MVYGDKHNDRFFEYFCERTMMRTMEKILRNKDFGVDVRVQVMQTVMILL